MDIASLAKLYSPSAALISLTFNRPPGPTAAVVTELLKPLRAATDHLDHAVSMSIRADVDRIVDLAGRPDPELAPATVVFASSLDDIFEVVRLPAPAWDHADRGRKPYLRALRAMPTPPRVGVAVTDRRRAEVFVLNDGVLAPVGSPIEADLGKVNYGGFQGYDEQRARSHGEAEANRLWKTVAAMLLEVHQQEPLEAITVGGHRETLDGLIEHFHRYLRRLPTAKVALDPRTTTPAILASRVEQEVEELRRFGETRLIDQVLDALHGSGPTATGTAAVLEAANAKAIEHLLVAGPFMKPGVVCPDCGWLGRTGESCPACGTGLEPTADVVAAAMEETLAAGGAVDQLRTASAIDSHGLVGILRFPI